jgi:hypothetical protein
MYARSSRPVSIEIDPATLADIDQVCRAQRCNFNELVVALLENYVKEKSSYHQRLDQQAA